MSCFVTKLNYFLSNPECLLLLSLRIFLLSATVLSWALFFQFLTNTSIAMMTCSDRYLILSFFFPLNLCRIIDRFSKRRSAQGVVRLWTFERTRFGLVPAWFDWPYRSADGRISQTAGQTFASPCWRWVFYHKIRIAYWRCIGTAVCID